MRFSKIKTKKIKEFLRRLLRILAEKAFLVYLALLFVAFIFGAIIYYQHSAAVEKAEIMIIRQPPQFQQKTYQNILEIWQGRESKLKEARLEELSNLPADKGGAIPEEIFDSSDVDQEDEITAEEPSDFQENDQEEVDPE